MLEVCYKLRFLGPLHIDGLGTGFYETAEPVVRSDTLSAAVAVNWLRLFPQDAESLFENPPWQASSAFPFWRKFLFFPRPVASKAVYLTLEKVDQAKNLKKIQWLELSLWKETFRYLALSEVEGREHWFENITYDYGSLGIDKDLYGEFPHKWKLWQEEERPRIAVDRSGDSAADGQIFHFSRIHYDPQGGLFFLARFEENAEQEKFEAALQLLGDSGLGSDRTSGHGHFDFTKTDAPDFSAVKQSITLSLVNPDPESDISENWLDGAAYDLTQRGGWISGESWRKAGLRMFCEGSCFSGKLSGRIVEVGEHPRFQHKIYRDGRAFMVGG